MHEILKKSELLEYWSLKWIRPTISMRTAVKVYKRFFSTTTGYSNADCDSLSRQLRTPNTKKTLLWHLELQPPHCEGPIVASEIENCRLRLRLISELREVFSVLTRINFCFTYRQWLFYILKLFSPISLLFKVSPSLLLYFTPSQKRSLAAL